jgi:hypothetical protein
VWLNQQKFNLREKIKSAKEGYNAADTQQSVTKMSQTGLSALHQQMSFSWCNRSYIESCTGGKEIILCGTSMSVETETNQKENGERKTAATLRQ